MKASSQRCQLSPTVLRRPAHVSRSSSDLSLLNTLCNLIIDCRRRSVRCICPASIRDEKDRRVLLPCRDALHFCLNRIAKLSPHGPRLPPSTSRSRAFVFLSLRLHQRLLSYTGVREHIDWHLAICKSTDPRGMAVAGIKFICLPA